MNNNNNNKMNNNNISNNSTNAVDPSDIASISAVITTPDSPERELKAIGEVYKAAARSLREYHGVPSMTAVDLQKTLALLQLHPRLLAAQGLAPSRLLKGEVGGEACEMAVAEKRLRDDDRNDSFDMDYSENETETKAGEEEEHNKTSEGTKTSDDPESDKDASSTKDQSKGTANRPVHTALLAGGVHLRPRETGPLLRALGVSPHRLVRLELIERESLHAMSGGRGHGLLKRRRGGGCRAGGMGGPRGPPRHGSPDGPPHGSFGRGPACGGTHGRRAPPRRGHGYFGDFGEQPHVESGGEEEDMLMHGPPGPNHGPGRHCPRHHGGGKLGKAHRPPHGPRGLHGLERDSMHHGPGRFGDHPHVESGGEEEGMLMHGPPGPDHGSGRHCPRTHGGGKLGKAHGPPHGPPGLHGLERGSMHHGPGRLGELSHDEESGGEDIMLMDEEPPGSPRGRGHHGHHNGPVGHRHGPMHGRRGPRGRMHAPPGSPPPSPPPDHDLVGPMCCAGEDSMVAPPGPGHTGSPTTRGEGGTPPHGPFLGLLSERAVHAPHGRMERSGHGPPRRGGRMGRGGGMHRWRG